jgi:CBS domain-containing protein
MPPIESIIRTDFKAVDKRDELHSVLGWLTGDSTRVPIVMDGEKPFGIVNERAMMSRKLEHKSKIETYTLVTRSVPRSVDSTEAAARLAEFRAAYLPVEDARGKCAGYVTALDLARLNEMASLARDLCLPVKSLTEKQSLGEALHLFSQEYVGILPVMNDGKLVGVLPRREVVRMELQGNDKGRKDAHGEHIHPLKDPVGGFMDSTAITLRPGASFAEVADQLDEHGYAIVQENGGPVLGMITPETLMRLTGASRTPR